MGRTVPSRPRETSQGGRATEEEGLPDKSLAPKFVLIPNEVFTKEASLIRLNCRVSGRPYPDVTWYRNGAQIVDDYTHKVFF